MRAARRQGPVRAGPARRDHAFHRPRRSVRAAGRAGADDRHDGDVASKRRSATARCSRRADPEPATGRLTTDDASMDHLDQLEASQRSHPARGLRQLQAPVHAVVDRQGQHGAAVAGAQGVLRPRAVSAHPHRHVVQDSGDDRVPRSAGRRVEPEPDLRPERRGARREADVPGRRRRPPHLLRPAQDRGAQADAERRVAALPVQPRDEAATSSIATREPFTGVIVGARADEEGSRSKERYFSPRDRREHLGRRAISRRSSGTSTRPSSRRARTCASIRCSTGPS